jgi:hypothetical protein
MPVARQHVFAVRGAAPQGRRSGVGRALIAAAAVQGRASGGRYPPWSAQTRDHRAHPFGRGLEAAEELIGAYSLSGEAFPQPAKAGASS